MELSSKVEYALLALIELADCHEPKNSLKTSQIAAKQEIPDRYLEQILNSLRLSGIIRSLRGAKGGYLLARDPWQITLLEVVNSVQGDSKARVSKAIAQSTTERDVVYEIWEQTNEEIQEILRRYTLKDFCQRRDARLPTTLMYYI